MHSSNGFCSDFNLKRHKPGPRQENASPELDFDLLDDNSIGRFVQSGQTVDAQGDVHQSFFTYIDEVTKRNAGNSFVSVVDNYSHEVPLITPYQFKRLVVDSHDITSPRRAPQSMKRARESITGSIALAKLVDGERATSRLATFNNEVQKIDITDDSVVITNEQAEMLHLRRKMLYGVAREKKNAAERTVDNYCLWGSKIVKLSMQADTMNNGYSLGFKIVQDKELKQSVNELYEAIRGAGYRKGLNSIIPKPDEDFMTIKIMDFSVPLGEIPVRHRPVVPAPPDFIMLGEIELTTQFASKND